MGEAVVNLRLKSLDVVPEPISLRLQSVPVSPMVGASGGAVQQPWYESAWRRAVLDMHITDDDGRFLSGYDPEGYAALLEKARTTSGVVYAMGHVGLSLFPSKVLPHHHGLKGRDAFGETVAACHARGIGVSAYMSVIFDNWAYRHHPDWKIIGVDGVPVAERSRYGVCCPNSPYRDYVAAYARELCERYEFEGIRFDMTFWPHVCYCEHCRARFAKEVGGEIPTRVHWDDPRWARFQKKREEWLAEFAGTLTSTALSAKPSLSVEHQASTFPFNWRFGVGGPLVAHNTFLQGDFYGDALQGSMARKLFSHLSPNLPAAFETSIAAQLTNYTALKPYELLRAKAHAALADGTAFVYIDSVDPMGSVNPLVYERMGRIFSETSAYEPFLGGTRVEDIAVYFSLDSKYDLADNGRQVDDPGLSARMPHFEAVTGVCKALIERHVPFGIITRRNLAELSRWRVVALPGVLAIDDEEAAALRAYVAAGGCLFVSGPGLLRGVDGSRRTDFVLSDVLGVSWRGETKERFTYMAPTEKGSGLFGDWTAAYPMGLYAAQTVAEASRQAEVLATITLPYTDPDDPLNFASTHNNPPGVPTRHPAVVLNSFGKGSAMWVAGPIETADFSQDVLCPLLLRLAGGASVVTNAPKVVEITTFEQREKKRYIVSLVNFPHELPPVPVENVTLTLRTGSVRARRVTMVPSGATLPFTAGSDSMTFTVPRVETFAMVSVELG